MSDQSQGEGWWLASDGKWYPPPSPEVPAQPPVTAPVDPAGASPTQPFGPPSGPPTETSAFGPPTGPPLGVPPGAPPVGPPGAPLGEPKKSGLGRGPIIAIAAAAIIIIAALVGFLVTRDDGKKDNIAATSSDRTDQSDRSTDASSDSASSSSSSQVKVPSGFKVIKDDKEGVSIAVPNSFTEINPSDFLNSSNQSDFSSQNPELAPFLSGGNEFLNGAVLAAMGQSDGNPAVVIVAKSPQRIDATDSDAASQLEDVFRTAGGRNITTDTVTLPAGQALRTGFTLDINAGASSSSVSETIYLVTVGRTSWAIFGVSVGGDASDLFDQIAKTFTVSS